MAKKVKAGVKLQIPAGKANPAPPVGPALGQRGVNIMEFFIRDFKLENNSIYFWVYYKPRTRTRTMDYFMDHTSYRTSSLK